MTGIPAWHITGDWFDNCSCAVACPCTFAQPPDNGFCESVLFWHIQRGHYGEVNLDGLSFVRVGRWEGDLWAGKAKGAAGLFIDERADQRQAEALPLRLSEAGSEDSRPGGAPCFPKAGSFLRPRPCFHLSRDLRSPVGAIGRNLERDPCALHS